MKGALCRAVPLLGVGLYGLAGCPSRSPAPGSFEAGAQVATLGGALSDAPAAAVWTDCVGVLHVTSLRGCRVANVHRLGKSSDPLRTTSRLADLAPSDLQAFCDWESCLRTNGYGHSCWVSDAGPERCRVCNGAADCDGRPLDQADCVAHATDPQRATCHVGLLQECLLQVALRGPADSRLTETCLLSEKACAGSLPGDLSSQALKAQHETDQVAIQLCAEEADRAARLVPGALSAAYWRQRLSLWDGGLPTDESDAGASDAGAPEGDGAPADGGDLGSSG